MKREESLHTFSMNEAFAHEDEGTVHATPTGVVSIMSNAKHAFPGVITAHQLARSLDVILKPHGFIKETTLLATSLCCDEVCRDTEDEIRNVYGQNFSFGGVAGFPFGGCMAFGAMLHHIPTDGQVVIVYASHVGIDYDGVVGRVNRRGHKGSGACCNTALASLKYVQAVHCGRVIHSPDASDPIDAQQVFIDSALMAYSERLLSSQTPIIDLPHVVNDAQRALLLRIMAKCKTDVPEGTKIALLGGVQVNTPEGAPEYFLPRSFTLCDASGETTEDLLSALIQEGEKDIKSIIRQKKLDRKMAEAKKGLVDVPVIP